MNKPFPRRPWTLGAAAMLLVVMPQDQARADRFVLEAGKHDLVRVIAASARFLGRNYLLSPSEVSGRELEVELQHRLELDAAGCEAVVSQLAYTHDLVATPLDRERGVWEFVNLAGARRADALARPIALAPAEVRAKRTLHVFVQTSVALEHAPAGLVAQSLRPFLSGSTRNQLTLGTGGHGTILLTGLADDVARALDLIATMDQPAPGVGTAPPDHFAALEARVAALEKAVERLRAARK